jgi:uncharacterized cupredoxin-like copper-binding protein
MKKLLLIASIGMVAAACDGNQTSVGINANTNSANANTAANSPANVTNAANTTNAANVSANKPANTAAAKPAPSGPTRVSFKKGEIGSTQSITLAPGASVQFILGATGAQNLYVTPASKDLTFKMLKGIGGEFSKGDDGMYSAETKGNNGAKGDILFEVKNTTAKEIKSSIKIEIEDFGD